MEICTVSSMAAAVAFEAAAVVSPDTASTEVVP